MSGSVAILSALIGAAAGGVPTFDPPIEIQFANHHFPTQLAAADFDQDGQIDLVVPGRDIDGLVYIVLRKPDGSFDAHTAIPLGVQTDWAEVADFDGDGHVDIALAVRATFGAVAVLRGHGDGTFDPAIFFPTERETRCVRVADMDHDGKLDLVAVNYGSNSIQVLLNQSTPGHLNFVHASETRLNRWTIGLPFPNWAALTDTNHDGLMDIVDFSAGGGRMNTNLNKGYAFGREKSWTSPNVAGSAAGLTFGAVADLDGDGHPDVIAHAVTTNHTNPILVWRGNADGGFDAAQFFAGNAIGTAFNVYAADMDGDGDQDLIALSVQSGNVSMIENRTLPGGPINLMPPVQILLADFPRHVAVLDFDNDGRPDLAVVDYTKHKLILLRNAGMAPSFVAPGDSSARPSGSLLAAGVEKSKSHSRARSPVESDDDEASLRLAIELGNIGPALPRGFAPVSVSENFNDGTPGSESCGPPAGDCLSIHAGPYCFTTPCCEIVCGFDPQCCETNWDADCVSFATSECKGIVCPSRGSCSEPHAGPGCEDAECCGRVTRLDPSCVSNWDAMCVELSTYACIDSAPQVIAPANAIDEAEHCYERLSEGCGRRSNPAHVPVSLGDIRKGHVTGDGARDIDAHVLVLTERKLVSLHLHADFPAQLVLSQGPCDGPLVTYEEELAAAGDVCGIDRILSPGEWRITVGMATPLQTLRNGQPCLEEDPNNPWTDGPPTPGFFGGDWWLSIDASGALNDCDFDGNGVVDGGDLGLVLLAYGDIESDFDVDGNGQVDGGDLGLVLLNFE